MIFRQCCGDCKAKNGIKMSFIVRLDRRKLTALLWHRTAERDGSSTVDILTSRSSNGLSLGFMDTENWIMMPNLSLLAALQLVVITTTFETASDNKVGIVAGGNVTNDFTMTHVRHKVCTRLSHLIFTNFKHLNLVPTSCRYKWHKSSPMYPGWTHGEPQHIATFSRYFELCHLVMGNSTEMIR